MLQQLRLQGFRIVHGVSRRLQRRLTPAGQLILMTTLAAGAVGLDTRQTLASQVFTLGLALLGLGLLSTPLFRPRIVVERQLPRFATVGKRFSYTVTLRNLGRTTYPGLEMVDELSVTVPTPQQFARFRYPGDQELNWFDRRVGYQRWTWLMRHRSGAVVDRMQIGILPASDSTRVRVTTVPLRRGRLEFNRIVVLQPDHLGLVNALSPIPACDQLVILPRRFRVATPQLCSCRAEQPGGVELATHVGETEEVRGVRDYRPGDPRRHIHWRSWAHAGRPLVKEFQDEFLTRHALVLDTCSEPGEAFEAAVSATASYVTALQDRENLVDLVLAGVDIQVFRAGRGTGGTDHLLEALACVQPHHDARIGGLEERLLGEGNRLSACLCVLLSWDTARRSFAKRLQAHGVEIQVIFIPRSRTMSPPSIEAAWKPEHFRVVHPDRIEDELAAPAPR